MAEKAEAGGASRALARATPRLLSGWLALLVLAFVVPEAGARSCVSSCVWDGKKVTLAGGTAPDGSRYDWVGHSRLMDLGKGDPERFMRLYCVDLRAGGASRAGASCWGPGKRLYEDAALAGGPGAFPYQRGAARPDVLIEGITDARVAELRVVYTDLAGGRHELAVNHVRVARERLAAGRSKRARKAIRGIAGFGLFAAFVPADWVARDKLFERERELRGTDPSLPPGGGPVDLAELMFRSVYSTCPGRPDGPIELTAYDTAGNELPTVPCVR